jgi:hypothetical protein
LDQDAEWKTMNKKVGMVFIGLGILFLLNAIFGRYLVLPGYLASLEQGQVTLGSVSQTVPVWKIIRYLLWAYSFKLGIYFIILGATIRTKMLLRRKWSIALIGFVYLAFAYIPLPSPVSVIFEIAGGFMTMCMIFIFLHLANERDRLEDDQKTQSDFRMAGYFFLAMATYTLCPIMGVKTFALLPEKMIRYSLQQEAASFAFHILIELVLGWLFIALSTRRYRKY